MDLKTTSNKLPSSILTRKLRKSEIRITVSSATSLSPARIIEEDEENEISSEVFENTKETPATFPWKKWAKIVKLSSLVAIWLVCSGALMSNSVQVPKGHQISVPHGETKHYLIQENSTNNQLELTLTGPMLPLYYQNMSETSMHIWIQLNNAKISETWKLPLVSSKLIDVVPSISFKKTFQLNTTRGGGSFQIFFSTNLNANFPIFMNYNLQPINPDSGIIYAALLLLALYILIIFELLHRTLAAMLASTMSLAILAALNARPTMSEIISWIDVETILLLFSMMTLVTVLSETGVFDYMAVVAYRITGGRIWPLINTLCLIAAVLSCFLDNVTTTLLTTPVTIRLCEVMKLNPVPVLIYSLIFANIGGVITPIGDPPNVIIASNPAVIKSGVNFGVFTLHMSLGAVISCLCVYAQLRYVHRDTKIFKLSGPSDVQDLKREIAVWKRAAASLSSYSKDEDNVKESLLKQSSTLLTKLRVRIKSHTSLCFEHEEYNTNLNDLKHRYPIKNKPLLIKSGLILLLVICVFFLHSTPSMSRLGLGWTALLGALLLLILYGKEDIEGVISRVEWSTLLFFASLFIMMEALARLGLIDWVGVKTTAVIMAVDEEKRLGVAVVLILWVSGCASAFVDNLPLTTMMIRIITSLASNTELPLQPLVWALSFGACFGGNGTLFGSSSNIVCAGVAEQHGYRFTFYEFTRIGLPVMVTSMVVISVYLFVCHIVFCWH